jgi:DNA-binding NtrC family response regulator
VRELESVVERALLFSGNSIGPDALPDSVRQAGGTGAPAFRTLREVEEEHIRRVLAGTGGVIKRAADHLGISRKTLYEKIKAYGIRDS